MPALKAGLAERGHELDDVRHLLLSHIHLDHAGAAGVLVREHPGLTVWVSEIGAPHLVDPSRLERSARRLYGEAFDELWGELAPVPEENVRVVGERVLGLECFPAPGHASHHVCYFDGTTLYAGDAAGVRIQPSREVLPPTPPPDVDVEGWFRTIEEIERRAPERLALIHFGPADDVSRHLGELRARLAKWSERVERGCDGGGVRGDGRQRPRRRRRGLRPRDAVLAVVRRPEALLGDACARSSTAPLREREFRLLFAGRTVSLVGTAIAPVALAFAVLDLTGSKTDLGLILAAREIPLIVFLLAGGIWADRLPRNRVMVGANAVSGLSQPAAAALLISGQRRDLAPRRARGPQRRRGRVLLPGVGGRRPADGAGAACSSRRTRCSRSRSTPRRSAARRVGGLPRRGGRLGLGDRRRRRDLPRSPRSSSR